MDSDLAGIDLGIRAPGPGTAKDLCAIMDRALQRLREEQTHQQLVVGPTVEEIARRLGYAPLP